MRLPACSQVNPIDGRSSERTVLISGIVWLTFVEKSSTNPLRKSTLRWNSNSNPTISLLARASGRRLQSQLNLQAAELLLVGIEIHLWLARDNKIDLRIGFGFFGLGLGFFDYSSVVRSLT